MADTASWIKSVRSSHDRFVQIVAPLSEADVEQQSYAKDWSIAQTASHLGSQAEIFGLFLGAGLSGEPAPGGDVFAPIWERWNGLAPAQQVLQSVAVNEAFVSRVEQTSADQRDRFLLTMFGRELDLGGLLAMRLGEHAVHTWDIAVALDDSATVAADAVDLLVDQLAPTAARSGAAATGVSPVSVVTRAPSRTFTLTVDPQVTLEPSGQAGLDPLVLPAEALVRLIYGRLDADHSPSEPADARLATLRAVFPGF